MNCLEFRRKIDTSPNCRDREFLQHKTQCGECGALAVRVSRFQSVLNDAVRFDTPGSVPSEILLRQSFSGAAFPVSRRKVLALAACIVAAAGVGVFGNMLLGRQSELAREVIALIRAAPYAMAPNVPLESAAISEALAPAGLALNRELAGVTFAGPCILKNIIAGHLVLRGSVAPITVFAIPGIRVSSSESIRGDSLRGELVPHGNGTLAIVGAPEEKLDTVREIVRDAIAFRSA